VIEEGMTRREELHPPGSSLEERRTDLIFERANLPAHGRLCDAQPLRRAADVAFLSDSDEVADLGEAHSSILQQLAVRRQAMRDRNGIGPARLTLRTILTMAIEILTADEVARMRRAGRAAAETLAFVGTRIRPGVSTAEIDQWVREDTANRGGRPSQLGYKGFPAAVCISRNEVVCHGIPSPNVRLRSGDIVNIDVTTHLDGYHGDTSVTFAIGKVSADALRLIDVARRCREAGIAVVREGTHLGDIGAAIEELANEEGVSVVTELGGHGIGRHMHGDPHVPHTGKRGSGLRLKAGMAITVEPMVNLGGPAVRVLKDGWTVVTEDGSLSAQFEHTVVVTRDGCEITTLIR